MTQVLRMENNRGYGPFVYQVPGMAQHVPWLREIPGLGVGPKNDHEWRTHPHHMLDIPGADLGSDDAGFFASMTGSPWVVGVKDKQQFLHWFPKSSLNWFTQNGFKADVYDVSPSAIRSGTYQLMFDKAQAKLVKSETPVQLEKEVA
jgi:hypothetical protein